MEDDDRMLVGVEAVRQDPSTPTTVQSTPTTVRVHCAAGTAVVLWQGASVPVDDEHSVEWTAVEWTIDEDIVWAGNTGPAASSSPKLSEDGDRIVFRGRMTLEEDGAAFLDVGGTLILFDLAEPSPPEGTDGSWVEVRVGRSNVSVWPCRL
ncbi:hypothetical protein [Streptomyces sp. JH34]|uniref:hypothetical protein n=1 Tax=Streptomyces sp. JH34 TaxID=2793633 RepID=UPI0023F7A051|nr:hypothetical protein [Streptomyces sp. JH34]MDF6022454.1 hypothetical protein [Streptomyces sp. JH34]